MATVTILHSADIHLGRQAGFGDKTAAHHRYIAAALNRLSELAAKADLWLLVGDSFDSKQPSPHQIGQLISAIAAAIEKNPSLHVILIPGNHDPVPVYERRAFSSLPPGRVHIALEPELIEIEDLGLAVLAVPWLGPGGFTWQRWPSDLPCIAAIHACFPPPQQSSADNFVVPPDEMARWPVRYIALGHYHNHSSHSLGDIPAVQAGAPEIMDIGQTTRGGAVTVEIDAASDGPATWSVVDIGQLECLGRIDVDASQLGDAPEAELRSMVSSRAGANRILRVVVSGLRANPRPLDIDGLLAELAPEFFYLDIVDATRAPVESIEVSPAEEGTVIASFVEVARRLIEQAEAAGDEERASILREALALGYDLLRGA